MSNRASPRCADAKPYLSALVDGEVAEPLRSAVEAHAATCQSCGAILARYQSVNNLVATLPASNPSPTVLENVLTVSATRRAMEPARRESLRRRQRGSLNLRRIATLLTLPQAASAPVFAAPRPRSFWQQTALPAMAALVLISFALVAFSRVVPNLMNSQISHAATPTPLGNAYQQAQATVFNAVHADPIAFTPEIPWSLPAGATFKQAKVDPTSRSLDILWNLTNTLAQLHVREAPVALADWNDYKLLIDSPALAWQLPGKAAWRAGTSISDSTRLVVVQDDTSFSVAVEVIFPASLSVNPVDATTQTQAVNVLRLASLSMDSVDSARLALPALVAPDALSSVIHYMAQSGSGASRTVSDVYVDSVGNRARVTVSNASGVLYEDFISGTTDTRYDPRHNVYSHLPTLSTALGDSPLDPRTASLFNLANSYLAYGEFWYVGDATWNKHTVHELAFTGAPYSTTIYVDVISDRVIGAEVNYAFAQNAGASGLPSYFTHNACLNYTSVEYLASAPANTFTPPQGYLTGTPPASAACAA